MPEPTAVDLEREIRQSRSYSLAEAIGRAAGPGTMKGASPVSLITQAGAALDHLLKDYLVDPEGALHQVLLREAAHSPFLLDHLAQPRTALLAYLGQVLGSAAQLTELVRETDAAWGRIVGERPFFTRDGVQPDPDDPYTETSVRRTLSELVVRLEGADPQA
jgi:hypothetical protein